MGAFTVGIKPLGALERGDVIREGATNQTDPQSWSTIENIHRGVDVIVFADGTFIYAKPDDGAKYTVLQSPRK